MVPNIGGDSRERIDAYQLTIRGGNLPQNDVGMGAILAKDIAFKILDA